MGDLLLFYWVLRLFERGEPISAKQLSDCTGCTLYAARKLFKKLIELGWVYRLGNRYEFRTESQLTYQVSDTVRAWDKAKN